MDWKRTDTLIGVPNNQSRSTKTKVAVVGLRARSTGRVVESHSLVLNSNQMQGYLLFNGKEGNAIFTSEAKFYKPIKCYDKLINYDVEALFVNGMASPNGMKGVWTVLKRGYNDTFHHFSKKHID